MKNATGFQDTSIFQGIVEFTVEDESFRAERVFNGYRVSKLYDRTYIFIGTLSTSANTPKGIYEALCRVREESLDESLDDLYC